MVPKMPDWETKILDYMYVQILKIFSEGKRRINSLAIKGNIELERFQL